MPSMHIVVSKREDKQYKGGPRRGSTFLNLGYNHDGEWRNFKVDDQSLFGMLEKGASGTVEYKEERWTDNDGNSHITNLVTGFSPDTGSESSPSAVVKSYGSHDNATTESIQKQVCLKVAGEVLVALIGNGHFVGVAPEKAATIVSEITNEIYNSVFPSLDMVVKKAVRTLDAQEVDPGEFGF